jgi:acetoacetyl-CoA synthetase
MDSDTTELWRPSNPESTALYSFKELIARKYALHLPRYEDLLQWSLSNLAPFWEEVWHFTGIKASTAYDKV